MVLVSLLVLTACTRMPIDRVADSRQPVAAVSSAKADRVAAASLNIPMAFTDRATGQSSQITVTSEYISANGRPCRRFLERSGTSAVASKGLSCQDSIQGWQEIPLATFAY